MKLPKILLALPILGLAFSSYAVHPYAEQLDAAKASFHVVKALEHDRKAKEEAIRDINTLSSFIQSKSEGIVVADLLRKMKVRLEGEQDSLRFMSRLVQPSQAGVKATWSLKTHKMLEAVTDLLTSSYLTEDNLGKIIKGSHLQDISANEETCPAILGQGFWGTTQGTRYELFLVSIAAELMNPTGKSPVMGVDVLKAAEINIDTSPIAHIVPLPALFSCDTSWSKYLTGSLFFVPDYSQDRAGFFMTHTGFLFGGHRNVDEANHLESRYPEGKLFGPEDCSSSVGKICDYKGVIATLYQWMFWKEKFEHDSYESILTQISAEPARDIREKVAEFKTHFEAINIEEMVAGDIIGWRTQAEGKPLGTGGHTGLFIGSSSEGNPIFLGPNRGLPQTQMDGFGLEEKAKPEGAEQFAMRPKSQASK